MKMVKTYPILFLNAAGYEKKKNKEFEILIKKYLTQQE
jgi:hypothetical protein